MRLHSGSWASANLGPERRAPPRSASFVLRQVLPGSNYVKGCPMPNPLPSRRRSTYQLPGMASPAPSRRVLSRRRPLQRNRHTAGVRRCLTFVVGLLLATTVSAGPAWAHGTAGGAEEGYVFVQQALGHLVHDRGPTGVADAEAKVQETLSATDHEGVDLALVRQAQAALTAGRITVAQQSLQQSIAAAISQLKPATGEQTGTTVVGEPLRGRGSLTAIDWTFGSASLLLLVAGVGLALRFRPALNLAQLRSQLTTAPATGTASATHSPPSSGNSVGGHWS